MKKTFTRDEGLHWMIDHPLETLQLNGGALYRWSGDTFQGYTGGEWMRVISMGKGDMIAFTLPAPPPDELPFTEIIHALARELYNPVGPLHASMDTIEEKLTDFARALHKWISAAKEQG